MNIDRPRKTRPSGLLWKFKLLENDLLKKCFLYAKKTSVDKNNSLINLQCYNSIIEECVYEKIFSSRLEPFKREA